jgi:hypothetical protein
MTIMKTRIDTLKLLCKNIVNRLERDKVIVFNPRLRHEVAQEIFELIRPFVWTHQDLVQKAFDSMGVRSEQIDQTQMVSSFAEDERFKIALSVVKNEFGNQELSGFYFQQAPKYVAQIITSYFMASAKIEEVFESDDMIEKRLLMLFKKNSVK